MELSEGAVSFPGLCFWAIAIYWQGRMEKGREGEKRREEKERGGEGQGRKLALKPNLYPRISPNG